MRFQHVIIIISSLLLLGSCAVSQVIQHNIQGNIYLQTKNYQEGETIFRQAIIQNPDDPQTNYYLGRFLLAQRKTKQALPYLRKAAALNPRDVDYLFWQGVAFGTLGKHNQERSSYQKVLAIKNDHLQSLIYLGHNQLKSKEYEKALSAYQKALHIWPSCPSALYNRALIAQILKRTPEEKKGWLAYLNAYPSGALAIRATDHLNRLQDFSYQNHYLGARTITLAKIRFKPFSSELDRSALPSLNVVGATASNMNTGTLQVIVYLKNDRKLAQSRAISIKKYLITKFPALRRKGIGISWFDTAEPLNIDGKKVYNPESTRFFLSNFIKTVHPHKKKKKL